LVTQILWLVQFFSLFKENSTNIAEIQVILAFQKINGFLDWVNLPNPSWPALRWSPESAACQFIHPEQCSDIRWSASSRISGCFSE